MKKSPFNSNCKYDYANKCDCSEDDRCGCNYPNNMAHNYSSDCYDEDMLFGCGLEDTTKEDWKEYDVLSQPHSTSSHSTQPTNYSK